MDDFEVFYTQHVPLVYTLARSLDGREAEDLTQETFLRAWRHFARLCSLERNLQRAWLIRTLRNLVTDTWRHSSRGDAVLEHEASRQHECPDQTALRLDLVEALQQLQQADREMVVLRYVLDMNSREIGELLELPEGTVRRRLAESRAVLAERLSRGEGRQ